METDPIVAEIRRIRELRAIRFGFDIESIVRDAQTHDATDERTVVSRARRRPAPPFGSVAEVSATHQ
jgi:hypothetical protein